MPGACYFESKKEFINVNPESFAPNDYIPSPMVAKIADMHISPFSGNCNVVHIMKSSRPRCNL
jgi:hypothetical protein